MIRKIIILLFIIINITNLTIGSQKTAEEKEKFFSLKKQLTDILAEEEATTKKLEQSVNGSHVLNKYAQYQQKLNVCREKEPLYHLENKNCPECRAALDEIDTHTLIYIIQKDFENEVKSALTDLIDKSSIYD